MTFAKSTDYYGFTGIHKKLDILKCCMKTSEAVARRIRELLTKNNMTQYRLCKNMAIHENTLATIMNAKNKSVNLNTILLISRGFGITGSEFLNDPLFENDDLEID